MSQLALAGESSTASPGRASARASSTASRKVSAVWHSSSMPHSAAVRSSCSRVAPRMTSARTRPRSAWKSSWKSRCLSYPPSSSTAGRVMASMARMVLAGLVPLLSLI